MKIIKILSTNIGEEIETVEAPEMIPIPKMPKLEPEREPSFQPLEPEKVPA